MSAPGDAFDASPEPFHTLDMMKSVPKELGEFFINGDEELKALCKQHPWLSGLDSADSADLVGLRQAFLSDGHTFMAVLTKFLCATKWKEFVPATCVGEPMYGPVLLALLKFVFVHAPEMEIPMAVPEEHNATATFPPSSQFIAGTLKSSDDDQQHRHAFFEALKSRVDERSQPARSFDW
jgi:hypothetical protein